MSAIQSSFIEVLLHDPCAYCGRPSEVTDHIRSRAHGGPNGWENLTGACRKCNGWKGKRSLLSFLGFRRSGALERFCEAEDEVLSWRLLGAPR